MQLVEAPLLCLKVLSVTGRKNMAEGGPTASIVSGILFLDVC
jgi:hypothetical protein